MKILIIGTGNVARANYLPVLAGQEDVDLHYYNRTRSKADACADEFGGTVHETLAAAMEAGPDAVFVLTKETTRADVFEALIPHRPRRVFSEKPLVAAAGQDNVTEDDFATARGCLNGLTAAGCTTAMIFNYRFFEQTVRARRIMAERDFGDPVNLAATVNYACWSHVIDLMHYLAGPIDRVSAMSGMVHSHGKNEAPDLSATLLFESGITGTILGTWALDFTYPLFDLSVNYEGGRVRMRGLDGELEVFDYSTGCGERIAITRNTSRWDWYKASFEKSIIAYLESIRAGGDPPVSGEWGLRELQVEAGFRRSIREGRPVILGHEFPLDTGDVDA